MPHIITGLWTSKYVIILLQLIKKIGSYERLITRTITEIGFDF